jgi:hypothetical protein
MTGMFGVAMCLRERHFGDPTCCTWISQGSPRSETELRQYCHNAAKTLANVLVRRPPDISVWDTMNVPERYVWKVMTKHEILKG